MFFGAEQMSNIHTWETEKGERLLRVETLKEGISMRKLLAVLIAVVLMAVIVPMTAMACENPDQTCDGTAVLKDLGTNHGMQCPTCDYVSGIAGHSYPDKWSAAQGNCIKTCECGHAITQNHTLLPKDAEVPATCTTTGTYATQQCSSCMQVIGGGVIPMLDHLYNWSADTATCVDGGEKTGTCRDCGATKKETTPALGHAFTEWGNNTATCTAGGTETRTCQRANCDYSETKPTSALLHEYTTRRTSEEEHWFVCVRCDEEGPNTRAAHVSGTPTEENKIDATCVKEGSYDLVTRCTDCQYVISTVPKTIPKLETHDYSKNVPKKDPTCTQDGHEAYMACAMCDQPEGDITVLPAEGHEYGNWVDDENGKTHTKTCINCPPESAAMVTEDHHWKVTKKGTPVTCTTDGWTDEKTCEDCGAVIPQTKIPKGHIMKDVPTKAPTCTKPGNKAYQECQRTGCDYSTADKDTVIPATGHSFGKWCWNGDYHERFCSNCTAVEKEVHKWDAGVTVRNATYFRKGKVLHHCKVCGSAYMYVYTPRLTSNPKTGDTIMAAVTVMAVAGIGLAGAVAYYIIRKKKK